MKTDLLGAEKIHLASLLEAMQHCVFFLDAASRKLPWPLDKQVLQLHKKDEVLFEALSAFNERFSKLQDTLAAAMRHALILLGEQPDSFLKVLAYYEKHTRSSNRSIPGNCLEPRAIWLRTITRSTTRRLQIISIPCSS